VLGGDSAGLDIAGPSDTRWLRRIGYDILHLILGGAARAYACALRSAGTGKRVALIEKDKVASTCLHRGFIPTKAPAATRLDRRSQSKRQRRVSRADEV